LDAEVHWLTAKDDPHVTVAELRLVSEQGAGAVYDARQKPMGGVSWRLCGGTSGLSDFSFGIAPVTRSLDAALAFAKAAFPGCLWQMNGGCNTHEFALVAPGVHVADGAHADAPRSILIATLRAMQEQGK
jgi:hypothetical protein